MRLGCRAALVFLASHHHGLGVVACAAEHLDAVRHVHLDRVAGRILVDGLAKSRGIGCDERSQHCDIEGLGGLLEGVDHAVENVLVAVGFIAEMWKEFLQRNKKRNVASASFSFFIS